eukprot:22919-Eustigmatos_ZCMA.PRE.1
MHDHLHSHCPTRLADAESSSALKAVTTVCQHSLELPTDQDHCSATKSMQRGLAEKAPPTTRRGQ